MSIIFDDDQDHPEARCDLCGGLNINWWADSDRWNVATRSLSRRRGHVLCPLCFVRQHELETGLHCTWTLVPTTFRPLKDAIDESLVELAERGRMMTGIWPSRTGEDTHALDGDDGG